MKLNALISDKRFINGPTQLASSCTIPTLTFGNKEPVTLRIYERAESNPSQLVALDPDAFQVSLEIGVPDTHPRLGFWTLTSAGNITTPVGVKANKWDVQEALRRVMGAVNVEGAAGNYIVSYVEPGIRDLPTVQFQGFTLSQAFLNELSPGTASTPAQYRIQILEVAPARIPSGGWTADAAPIACAATGSGEVWTVTIDATAQTGFYRLIVDGKATGVIPVSSSPLDVMLDIAELGYTCRVANQSDGSLLLVFKSAISTLTIDSSLLSKAPSITGLLDLTKSGLREMLDNLEWISTVLTVSIKGSDDSDVTIATAPVIIKMPVTTPEAATIDIPSGSGLELTISEDGSYMNVFQNDLQIARIPLVAPAL